MRLVGVVTGVTVVNEETERRTETETRTEREGGVIGAEVERGAGEKGGVGPEREKVVIGAMDHVEEVEAVQGKGKLIWFVTFIY